MSVTLNGTSGLVFGDGTIQGTAAGMPFRNRIINGDMRIDQRNNGASTTPTVSGTYTVDRWAFYGSIGSKLSYQQNAGSVIPPAGFSNYLGITSTSAYSILSTDAFRVYQPIEGNNMADWAWGTSDAKAVTLSFWVRSSLTGTFGGAIYNASNYSYTFAYTINTANTWEKKTITIVGPTTSSFPTNNTAGVYLQFSLGAGSANQTTPGSWGSTVYLAPTGQVNVTGTSGATFYITGIQIEKAAAATDFEFRPYGTELAMCQRYCVELSGGSRGNYQSFLPGMVRGNNNGQVEWVLPVSMRNNSYSLTITPSSWSVVYGNNSSATPLTMALNPAVCTANRAEINFTVSGTPLTAGQICFIEAANSAATTAILSAEL